MNLKSIVGPKSGAAAPLLALVQAMGNGGDGISIEDAAGRLLFGTAAAMPDVTRAAVMVNGAIAGFVSGAVQVQVDAVAGLVAHLAAKDQERRALAGEVLHLYREVHLIEQLSEQLAAMLDLRAVGSTALDQARRLISATRGAVFVIEKVGGPLRTVADFGGGIDEAVLDLERGTIVNGEVPRICVPLKGKQRTAGVLAIANENGGAGYTAADLKLLNTIALQTAAAIDNSFLCAEMVGAARDREQLASIQKELDTARTIQLSLVPRDFPPFPDRTDFEIHARMTAARSVGGDFFDFFLIDADRLGVVIGDVSGKGIPAALYMAVTRTQVKTTALEGLAPEACLAEVNRVLVREKGTSMYATCFYGILNTRSGEFRYCNAGHNPPLLMRAHGDLELLKADGGLPLGLFGGMPYTGGCAQLSPGDGLFLFTDGVTEANNAALDDFTDERLAQVLRESAHLDCEKMVDRVSGEVLSFVAGAPQSDDITMVALRLGSCERVR